MLSASDLIKMVSNIRGRFKSTSTSVAGNVYRNLLGGREVKETLAYVIALQKCKYHNRMCGGVKPSHTNHHRESNTMKTVPKQAKAREKL